MNNLQIVEHKGQRILTTRQIADGYGTNDNVIAKNFARNRERYQEGKHYFCLKGEELRQFLSNGQIDVYSPNTPMLYLWTEHGALLHAKSLGTDQAWEVYEQLVDTYFRARDVFTVPQTLSEALFLAAGLQEQIEKQRPLIAFAETAAMSKDCILVRELAKICCKDDVQTGEKRLFKKLREWGHIMWGSTEPYQAYIDRGYYKVSEGTHKVRDEVKLQAHNTFGAFV